MAALFLAALAGARERVWITVPYLVPDEPLLAGLRGAALRGVDVQIIIPASSDSSLVDGAGRTFHQALLDGGVKIHGYGPPMIHAKTWAVDRSLAIVGSPNLDTRSLRLNFEVAAVVYGGTLPDELAALFQRDLQRTHPAGRDARLPVGRRLFDSVARLLAPQL
jgi:cardiolipin synthase